MGQARSVNLGLKGKNWPYIWKLTDLQKSKVIPYWNIWLEKHGKFVAE